MGKSCADLCVELKCFTDLVEESASPSPGTVFRGDTHAFGNTEDRMLAVALGKKGRGRRDDGAFNPLTGRGYVKEQRGHYADALHKGNCVWVLIVEPRPL